MKMPIPFITIGCFLIGSYAAMYQVGSLNDQEVFNICATNVSLDDPHICPFWNSFANVSCLVLGGIDTNFLTAPTTVATKGLSVYWQSSYY